MFVNNKVKVFIRKGDIFKYYLLMIFTIFIAFIETLGIGSVVPLSRLIFDTQYIFKIKSYLPFLEKYSDQQNIFIFLLMICLIFIIKNFLTILYIFLTSKFNAHLRKNITEKLYDNFLNQNYSFHQKNSSQELIKNINMDSEDLRFGMHHFFLGIAEIFIATFLMGLLLIYNFKFTLIVIILFLFIIFFYKFFVKKISLRIGKEKFISMTLLQRHVKDTLSNIKIINIFSSKEFFTQEFKRYNNQYIKSGLYSEVITNTPRAIIETSVIFLIISLLYYNYSFKDSSYIFSSIGLYGLAFFRLMPAFNRILTAYSHKNILKHTINQLYNIFVLSTIDNKDINQKENILSKNRSSKKIKNIKFEKVSFSYDGKKNILEEINFEINENKFVGIIGESGVGKSTLINLLLGLLEPTNGSVVFNGSQNIYNNIQIFKRRISYVPQTINVLEKSIKENIAFGQNKNDIDLEKINQIIKKVHLEKFISKLKDGLDSNINSDNINVSGGELQRIGLARALYFDSDLLILDESTNSLDDTTEKEILNMIYKNFLGKKIIIFISHKIQNLKKTDFILKLNNKKVEVIKA